MIVVVMEPHFGYDKPKHRFNGQGYLFQHGGTPIPENENRLSRIGDRYTS